MLITLKLKPLWCHLPLCFFLIMSGCFALNTALFIGQWDMYQRTNICTPEYTSLDMLPFERVLGVISDTDILTCIRKCHDQGLCGSVSFLYDDCVLLSESEAVCDEVDGIYNKERSSSCSNGGSLTDENVCECPTGRIGSFCERESCNAVTGSGPHRMECLREWWADANCSARAGMSPEYITLDSLWHNLTAAAVRADMLQYRLHAHEGIPYYVTACEGAVYKVTVFTANTQSADSNGNIYLALEGDTALCEEYLLGGDGFVWQINAVDEFNVTCAGNIGRLQMVHLRIEGQNGLKVNKLLVTEVTSSMQYYVPCVNLCWLDEDQIGGTMASITLVPVWYRIMVFTSIAALADSNSTLYVQLHGQSGSCGESQLGADGFLFEANSVIIFEMPCSVNISRLDNVTLRIGGNDEWNVDKLLVEDLEMGLRYNMPCSDVCWLDADLSNGSQETITLLPGSYKVTVFTAYESNSDSNSPIYLQLYGDEGQCEEFFFGDNYMFMINSAETFDITCGTNIGKIESAVLRNNGTEGWRVDKMRIEDIQNDITYFLPCVESCYINYNPEEAVPSSLTLQPVSQFELAVYSGNWALENTGTEDAVYVTLAGSAGQCDEYQLPASLGTIYRDSKRLYTLQCGVYIGDLETVTFRLASSDGWYMETVTIRDDMTGGVLNVPCSCWFDNGANAAAGSQSQRSFSPVTATCDKVTGLGPHSMECLRHWWYNAECSEFGTDSPDNREDVDFWNDKTVRDVKWNMTQYASNAAELRADYPQRCYGLYVYRLSVFIGEESWSSGTAGPAFITLYGDTADCVETRLGDDSFLFYTNAVEKFDIQCSSDLGPLVEVNVRNGGGDNWNIESVQVEDVSRGITYFFPCTDQCWISCDLTEAPAASITLSSVSQYTIDVYSMDRINAETTDHVHVTLTGTLGTCPQILLESANANLNMRNLFVTFTAQCDNYIGIIQTAQISLTGTDGWFMNKLIIHDDMTGDDYVISCMCCYDNGNDAASYCEPSRTISPGSCDEESGDGPHRIECLREWWWTAGCDLQGTSSPDNSDLTFWNSHTVESVKNDMAMYKVLSDEGTGDYPQHCQG